MPDPAPWKLLPRNLAARRAGAAPVAGNPASTRLESGVGNCYPGLECDLRNLERRFFPFLEVETQVGGSRLEVVGVDLQGVTAAAAAGALSAAQAALYGGIGADLGQGRVWSITALKGDFGPLGALDLQLEKLSSVSIGAGRLPVDAWTAVRLLKQGAPVRLTLARAAPAKTISLTGARVAYLDADGALSRIFEVGELTQSLCSPWTHDFRDCGCFYWASNHPDIALPPMPAGAAAPLDNRWNLATAWERRDRSLDAPPAAGAAGAGQNPGQGAIQEMSHHEINRRWQEFNFVLERRERIAPYQEQAFAPAPLGSVAELSRHLRYAAGVELAVTLEYLAAAWSLAPPPAAPSELRDDLRAAFAEILRIAVGEMNHLRAVNDVLRALPGPFTPALGVATVVPLGAGSRPLQFRPATLATLDDFIGFEAPSDAIDGLYAPILASLDGGMGDAEQRQAIRTVMAGGEDHWQTFRFIREWLARHGEALYLRAGGALNPAGAAHPAKVALQQRYAALLDLLFKGLQAGMPQGASSLNHAREGMLGASGIEGALESLAAGGFLVTFDPPVGDGRFAPIPPP